MGICIAYTGKLREPALVPEFVRDLKAKAEAVGWPCKTMDELVAEGLVTCAGLEGITLYPHRECEPLHFHFDREGTFVNHTYYTLLGDTEKAAMMRQALAESAALMRRLTEGSQDKAGRRDQAKGGGSGLHVSIGVPGLPEAPGKAFFEEGLRYNWTKTQFAGAKVHAAVCAILHLVKQRYAPELEVKDDSGYFADEDDAKLEAQLAYADYLTSVASQAVAAAAAPGAGPMTLEAFVDRINEELAEAKNKLH
jgi:hypothetical protein